MAITTSCPGCKSLFRLPDDLAGQEVRCQKCERLFTVPMRMTVEPPASAPTIADVPAPAAEPTVAAPPPASAPAKAPPKAPALAATIEFPAIPKTESAKPAPEPASATVDMPAPKLEPKAAPAPPKTPAPPERPASVWGSLLALGLFLIATLAAGGVSAAWVFSHLEKATRVAYVQPPPPIIAPPPIRFDFGKDGIPVLPKDRVDFDKKDGVVFKPNEPFATRINFGFGAKANFNDRIENPAFGIDHGRFGKDGAYRLFRAHLDQGRTYNFFVNAENNFTPGVQIFDGNVKLAGRLGETAQRVMVSCRPNRTGDHLIFVTSQQKQPGNFFMSIAPEEKLPPFQINVATLKNYTGNFSLRVEDPLDPMPVEPEDGPYREFEIFLRANEDYTVTVTNAAFPPVLHIFDGAKRNEHLPGEGKKTIQVRYSPVVTGKHRMRITSDQFGLGAFTFSVNGRQLQTILARLDGDGKYDEQRALTKDDPVEPGFAGRGAYKVYLIPFTQGQTYTIEMTSNDFDTYLGLYDSANRQVETNVSKVGAKKAEITFQATETGTYRLHAAAARPKVEGAYTLKIVQK